MTVLISGGAKSGKSSFAQDLAVAMSEPHRRYYVATMISSGKEDDARIRHHIADRAGMDFFTIECGKDILSCLRCADPEGTFLVDSATALLQNAIFPAENNYAMDLDAANRCADDLLTFARSVKNAVIVSDYIYSDAECYDEGTEMYRKCLADIDRRLAAECDTVVEVMVGQVIVHKGDLLI